MKIKGILAAALIAVSSLFIVSPVMAEGKVCPENTVKAGKEYKNSLAECNIEDDDSLMPTIQQIINVVIGLLGIVAVIVVILGGVQYTLSTGDSNKINKAKDTILYGIIGLVISILAYAIVNFVLGNFFKSDASKEGASITYVIEA